MRVYSARWSAVLPLSLRPSCSSTSTRCCITRDERQRGNDHRGARGYDSSLTVPLVSAQARTAVVGWFDGYVFGQQPAARGGLQVPMTWGWTIAFVAALSYGELDSGFHHANPIETGSRA